MNNVIRNLNAYESLQKNIDKYIDVFVDYYGEDKREEIENKFKKAIFIGYISPEKYQIELRNLIKIKSEELKNEVLNENETTLTKDDLFQSFDYSLDISHPIKNYLKFIELYSLGSNGRKNKYIEDTYNNIKKYLKDLTKEEYLEIIKTKTLPEKYQEIPYWLKNNIQYTSNLNNIKEEYLDSFNKARHLIEKAINKRIPTLESFDINNEEIKKLNILVEKYKETLKKYELFKKENEEYFKEVEENEKLRILLSDKYYKEYLKENIDLIKDEYKSGIIEYLNDDKKSYLINYSVKQTLGSSILSESLLESFYEENEKKLANDEVESYKKNNIIGDRIKYFNNLGINLGNDYNKYLENEEVKRLWPTKERLEKFKLSKNKLINNFMNDYYSNIVSHKKLREKVDSSGLLSKDDGIDSTMYSSSLGKTCVCPNIIENNGTYELSPIILISFGGLNGALDHDIIHELNHVYELNLESIINNKVTYLCGWDIVEDEISQTQKDYIDVSKEEPKRNYELFNEIINEIIAEEIEEKMHERGIYILDSKEDSKVTGNTSYESSFFIVKDFYQEFREEIIKSRSNGNIKEILDLVGEKNFNDLNNLFEIYFEHLSGFKKMQLMNDLRNHKNTELTEIYYEIIDKSKEIFEKMKEERKKKIDKEEGISI